MMRGGQLSFWQKQINEFQGKPIHLTGELSKAFFCKIPEKSTIELLASYWPSVGWPLFWALCWDNSICPNLMQNKEAGWQRQADKVLLCGNEVPVGPAGCGVGNPVVNPNVGMRDT